MTVRHWQARISFVAAFVCAAAFFKAWEMSDLYALIIFTIGIFWNWHCYCELRT